MTEEQYTRALDIAESFVDLGYEWFSLSVSVVIVLVLYVIIMR